MKNISKFDGFGRLAFDLGGNIGGNIEYYLTKFTNVVVVEANKSLCEKMFDEFKDVVECGRLKLVNACVVSEGGGNFNDVAFYVHKFDSALSSFIPPKSTILDYRTVHVPSYTYSQLVEIYGAPDFVKIDLEGLDGMVINDMVSMNLMPRYLQFENQDVETLRRLVNLDFYKSFNIVSFVNFQKIYGIEHIRNAGPIGEDIISPWLRGDNIITLYQSITSYSWFDIHMTSDDYVLRDVIEFAPFYKYSRSSFESLVISIKMIVPERLKRVLKEIKLRIKS
jgi:FkbM family methyltransferase